jgi:beta-lactamase regulating signal transducer with metallopeptidase domain/ankyrin repeat protein
MIWSFDNSVAELLGSAAAEVTGVLLAGFLITRCMRRSGAAARHLVWTLALSISLVLPIARWMTPQWKLAVLPPAEKVATREVKQALPEAPLTPGATSIESTARFETLTANSLPVSLQISTAPTGQGAVRPSILLAQPPRMSELLLAIWCFGTAAIVLYRCVGLVAVFRLTSSAEKITGADQLKTVAALCSKLGLQKQVVVRTGAGITMPLTAGLFRPSILLPIGASDWSAEKLRSVLLHELAHVKRHDCATQLLAQITCAVHWFNPLAWIAASMQHVERERACDDVVLCEGADPVRYADLLLAIAVAVRHRRFADFAALAMARRSGLRDRVTKVLCATVNRRPVNRGVQTLGVSAALLVLVCLSAVKLTGALPPTLPDELGDVSQTPSRDSIREFHSAVAAGDSRLVAKMLSTYPDLISSICPDEDPAKKVEPIFTAVDHGQCDMIKLLLKHGGSYAHGANGQTPLDRATVFGTLDVVKTLLDAGANVDGLDDPADMKLLDDPAHGTPLRDAVLNEHFDIARLLVQRGARVDIQTAAGLGWTSWVTRQVAAHPELTDVTDGWRYTPLCYAVDGGCAGTAEVLLSHGADVGHTFDDGQTLLQLASASGYHDLIEVLLAHGGEINAKNKAGETAVDYAIKFRQQDTIELLRQHGGKRGLDLP